MCQCTIFTYCMECISQTEIIKSDRGRFLLFQFEVSAMQQLLLKKLLRQQLLLL